MKPTQASVLPLVILAFAIALPSAARAQDVDR